MPLQTPSQLRSPGHESHDADQKLMLKVICYSESFFIHMGIDLTIVLVKVTVIYATADDADAYMFYRCFFVFFCFFFLLFSVHHKMVVLGNG